MMLDSIKDTRDSNRVPFFLILNFKTMDGIVVVKADDQGNIIGVSANNPEYGYVKLQQLTMQINDEGWLRQSLRTALIKGKVEDLIASNFKAEQVLPGKIIVRESLTPFNPENPDKNLKIAGATGIVCRVDDQPIYRQTFYTQNENAIDEFIMHDNTTEIKEVMNAQKEISSLSGLSKLRSKLAAAKNEEASVEL